MNHKGTIRIETERLILRPFVLEDADAMYRNWASDPEVTKYLTWPTHSDPKVTAMLLKLWTEGYANPEQYNWCIQLKSGTEAIGNISVVEMKENIEEMTIGYCMSRSYWGQGIMPEALKAVIHFLFTEVGANRISACHDTANPKSGRVMAKAGMQYEGTFRAGSRNNQGIADTAWYAILTKDYI